MLFTQKSRRSGSPARLPLTAALLALALVSGDPGATETPEGYSFATKSGLHSTIVAKKDLPKITFKYRSRIKLKTKMTGYEKDLSAHATWQDGPAHLAVLLVGMPARARDDASRLWSQYLHEAGLHVLVFDSVFHPDFYGATRHGVPGNMLVEAEVMARVIDLAIDESGKRDRIRDVRLLGISYGGNVALTINQMAGNGSLGWKPGRVLALSPTIEMRTTAGLLDRWAAEDLEPRSLMDLLPLATAKPLGPGEKTPFPDSLMRAGIAWVLKGDLARTVKTSDALYDLGLLKSFKKDPDPHRAALASAKNWGFTDFWELMAFPGWEEKGGPASIDAFWDMSGIDHLLAERPGNVRVIVTEDDPLNSPADLERLELVADPEALVVLPHGGHLGYTRTGWIRDDIAAYLGGP